MENDNHSPPSFSEDEINKIASQLGLEPVTKIIKSYCATCMYTKWNKNSDKYGQHLISYHGYVK